MALGSTHSLTEMSTRNISWGKGGLCVGPTTLLPSCADCLEIWEPQTPGTLRVCKRPVQKLLHHYTHKVQFMSASARTYIHIHTHTHTHIYIYMYVCVISISCN